MQFLRQRSIFRTHKCYVSTAQLWLEAGIWSTPNKLPNQPTNSTKRGPFWPVESHPACYEFIRLQWNSKANHSAYRRARARACVCVCVYITSHDKTFTSYGDSPVASSRNVVRCRYVLSLFLHFFLPFFPFTLHSLFYTYFFISLFILFTSVSILSFSHVPFCSCILF
jgi:hypothetical protein